MQTYTIKSNRNQQTKQLLAFKGEAQTVQLDFSPWETDNGTVTSVTWTVKSGQASIANESLSSSVAQATITTSDTGRSMITVAATAGNNIIKLYLHVFAKDPNTITNDYGILEI